MQHVDMPNGAENLQSMYVYAVYSKLATLKLLLYAHDCCNRNIHGGVLGGLDGYIIDFMLSLKRVLWLATESVGIYKG